MKIIDRYILKESIVPIMIGISVFTFLFLLDVIVNILDIILISGASFLNIIRMLSFYLPSILTETIPLGIFVGVVITFVKFSGSSEAMAMNSMGMSIKEILKPISFLGIGAIIFVIFLHESIIPRSYDKLQHLFVKLAYESTGIKFKNKMFIDKLGTYSIYVDSTESNKIGEGIVVFDKKDVFPSILIGEKTFILGDSLRIKNATFFKFNENGSMDLKGNFEEKSMEFSSYLSEKNTKLKEIQTKSAITLLKEIKNLERSGNENKSDNKRLKLANKIEINRKIVVALSALGFSLLGVLLTITHNRVGSKKNLFTALMIVVTYISFFNVGLVMVKKGELPIIIGIWGPIFLIYLLNYILYKIKLREGI